MKLGEMSLLLAIQVVSSSTAILALLWCALPGLLGGLRLAARQENLLNWHALLMIVAFGLMLPQGA